MAQRYDPFEGIKSRRGASSATGSSEGTGSAFGSGGVSLDFGGVEFQTESSSSLGSRNVGPPGGYSAPYSHEQRSQTTSNVRPSLTHSSITHETNFGLHSQQQHIHSSSLGTTSGNIGNDIFNTLAPENAMIRGAAQMGLNQAQAAMQSGASKYLPGVSLFWSNLKFHFNVNNRYVLNKLLLLMFPFLSKELGKRTFADEGSALCAPRRGYQCP